MNVNDLLSILRHPGFFQIERLSRTIGINNWEWRYQVGIALHEGRVTWFDEPSMDSAVLRAAEAIRRVEAGEKLRHCANCGGPHFEPQGLCDYCNSVDEFRKMYPKEASPA